MKKSVLTAIFAFSFLVACNKTETQQTTGAADYAETHEDLIQNKEEDSASTDTATVSNRTATDVDSIIQNR